MNYFDPGNLLAWISSKFFSIYSIISFFVCPYFSTSSGYITFAHNFFAHIFIWIVWTLKLTCMFHLKFMTTPCDVVRLASHCCHGSVLSMKYHCFLVKWIFCFCCWYYLHMWFLCSSWCLIAGIKDLYIHIREVDLLKSSSDEV